MNEDDKKKFDEVMNLMSKYDKAEAHAKWVASPEFAKQKVQKKIDELNENRKQKENEKLLIQ